MERCTDHRDDLALLAGGDLADSEGGRSLKRHLAACEGCRALLGELQADLVALAEVSATAIEAQEGESLAGDVLRRLAATEFAPTERPARESRRAPAGANLRAAAAVLVVVTAFAGSLALKVPLQDPAAPADAAVMDPAHDEIAPRAAGPVDGLPIRVRRAGAGLELEWTGDGRESALAGPATTYRVVASAFPNDFDGGRTVEVAGEHLMASGQPFPSRRLADRDLTYFRVE